MEQADEGRAAAEVEVADHHHNNNNHYAAGLTQLLNHHTSKPLTATSSSMSYFSPEIDYFMYPGLQRNFLFNHDPGQQQPCPDQYIAAAAGGLIQSFNNRGNEAAVVVFNNGSSNNSSSSRWPREETMSLLQIRSRLHPNFKQATHKGPLWDEVSRIMYEEHGYERSGKKCREKFENLYKYYKKTKEAKSGKHDGKHYRFFRQLEALYGDDQNEVGTPTDLHTTPPTAVSSSQVHFPSINNETTISNSGYNHLLGGNHQQVCPNNQQHNMKLPCDQSCCFSLSNHNSSSHFTSSSSEDNNKRSGEVKKNKYLEVKIKEFIDTQMKSLIKQQQVCMNKVMLKIEEKRKESALREEEWRQQAEERLEKEHKYWENERVWMKARDAALMEALQEFTSSGSKSSSSSSQRVARANCLASSSQIQQITPYSSCSVHPSTLMTTQKPAEFISISNPLALYNNQQTEDDWLMVSNHHHHSDDINSLGPNLNNGDHHPHN